MRGTRLAAWWLLPLVALIVDLIVIGRFLPGGPVRDEVVFLPAARAFADAGGWPSLEFLRSYPAPQAPLGLYLAGRLLRWGAGLGLLRVLDAVLMAAALAVLGRALRGTRNALWGPLLFALNPYYHLVATHFYTDAPYLLLVALIVGRVDQRRGWALVLAPLVRQLGAIYAFGEALAQRRLRPLLALVPLLLLCVLWRGLTPDGERSQVIRQVHAAYGPVFPYIASYHVAALGFYLSPLAVRFWRSRRFWIGGAVALLASALAPAHANFSTQLAETGIQTLGLLHRLALHAGARGVHAVLGAFAVLGGGLIAESLAVRGPLRYFVGSFIVVSALGFQAWDKYVLELVLIVLVAIRGAVGATSPTRQSRS